MNWQLLELIIDQYVEETVQEYREELEYAFHYGFSLRLLERRDSK